MTSPHPSGGILWDLDGTLIDSAEQHYAAWRDALARRGREHTREEFFRGFGRRNDVILREIFGDTLTPEEAAGVADDREERYRRLVREQGLEPLPGVTAWLTRLSEAGFRQALATSAPAANVAVVVEVLGLGRFFDATVSAEDVERGKPDPAVFLLAARRISVAPERCVVVEDAPAGLEGARRAGMKSVGILSSHYPELRADIVVPSLADLPAGAIEDLLQR
jgi:HAD superfamily hydrolase (TIGR01509 family)